MDWNDCYKSSLRACVRYRCHLLLVSHARSAAFCSYTNKDNLKWQQSIIPQQKVIAAPSLALAEYRRAVPSSKIKVTAVFFCFFLSYSLTGDKGVELRLHFCVDIIKKRRNLYFHCIDSGSHLNPCKPSPPLQLCSRSLLECSPWLIVSTTPLFHASGPNSPSALARMKRRIQKGSRSLFWRLYGF